MLTLYALPASLYSAKVRIVLRYKRLKWQEALPPGGYGSAFYKTLVPSGNLPALEDDGFLMSDSEAIAAYLDEKYPIPPLLPNALSDRARMRERARFHDTRLEPQLRVLFPHISPDHRDTALAARQSQEISLRLGQLAQILAQAPDLAFGLGDVGYPATCLWIDALTPILGLQIVWPKTVRAYLSRLRSESAVRAELATYQPAVSDWLAVSAGA